MQPNTGIWGVHVPSSSSFWRFLMSRSRCAGVSAARHKPSHSPTSAQTRPPSCVGVLQIGFGKRPAGPHFPPALSQASWVRGISNCAPHDLSGVACRGWPTAIHVPPLQVQYPAAWLDTVLPVHASTTNKMLKPRARVNRLMTFIGSGAFSRSKALPSVILSKLMKKHQRLPRHDSNQEWRGGLHTRHGRA